MSERGCSVDGCERKHSGKGLCRFHYDRQRRGIPLDAPPLLDPDRGCSVDGCERKHVARGLCAFHYDRMHRGKPLDAPVKRGLYTVCTVDECDKPHEAHGLCKMHYERLRQGKPLIKTQPRCSVEECERASRVQGMCAYHYGLRRRDNCTVDEYERMLANGRRAYANLMVWREVFEAEGMIDPSLPFNERVSLARTLRRGTKTLAQQWSLT